LREYDAGAPGHSKQPAAGFAAVMMVVRCMGITMERLMLRPFYETFAAKCLAFTQQHGDCEGRAARAMSCLTTLAMPPDTDVSWVSWSTIACTVTWTQPGRR